MLSRIGDVVAAVDMHADDVNDLFFENSRRVEWIEI